MNPATDDRDDPGSGATTPLTWGRRVLLAFAGVLLSVIVLAGLAVGALQIDAVSGFVARTAAAIASSDSLHVEVTGATGSWVGSLELTDLEISARSEGEPAWRISADTASARYDLLPLLRRHVSISDARITGLTAWSALSAPEKDVQEEGTAPSRWSVAIDQASVDVRELALAVPDADEPWRLADGVLRIREVAMGEELRSGALDTLMASFQPPGRPVGWGRVAASGALEAGRVRIDELLLHSPESDVSARGRVPLTLGGTAPEGLELAVSLAPLHLEDVGPFLPSTIPDSLRVRGEGRIWTSSDTAHVRFQGGTDVPGRLSLDGRVWGSRAAPEVAGVLDLTSVDLMAWGFASRELVLEAAIEAELADASPEELQRAHGTMRVEARIDDPEGRVGGLRLDVGAQSAGSPWRGSWTASGLGLDGDGHVVLDLGEEPEWSLDGAVSYVLQEGRAAPTPPPKAAGGGFRPQAAAARFDAEGRGFAPDSLTGRLTLDLDSLRLRVGGGDVSPRIGPGQVHAEVRQGQLSAELFMEAGGGRVDLALDGNVPEQTIDSIRASLAGVDVASIVGDTLASSVHADLSGKISTMSPLRASGSLRVHAAEYGPWTLDSARASVDARDGDVLMRLAAALPDSGRVGARGTFRLEDGVVRRVALDSLEWAHLDLRTLAAASDSATVPSTALFGGGEGAAALDQDGWRGTLALRMGPSTVGRASLDAGSADVRVSPDMTEVQVVLEAGETLVEAEVRSLGSGDDRLIEISELRFREVDLAAWMPGDATPTRLTGSASGELLGTDPAQTVGGGRLDLWSSSIGTTGLDTASLTVSADSGYIQAEAMAEGLGGTLNLKGDGELGGARPTYSVRGSVERSVPGEAHALTLMAHFGLAGQGTQPDSMNADVWLEVDSARWAGHEVERGSIRAGIGEGVLRVDTVSVALPGAELAAGGELPLGSGGGGGELRLRGSLTRAELVQGLRNTGTLAIGEAGVDVAATGAVDDLRIEGNAFVTALLVDDIRVQGLELSGGAHRTAAAGWVEGQATLEIDRVRLPTAPVQSVRLEANLEPGDELALEASAVIDGRRDAQLSMRVEELPAPAAVRLESMAFRADQDQWTLAHPTRVSVRDGVEVDSLLLATESERLEIRGRFGTEGPLDLHVSTDGFDIATVADLLGYPTLRGRITGAMDLGGTAASPLIEASLRSRLEPTDAPAADLAMSLGYEEGAAELEGSVTLDDGPSLRSAATVPFQLSFADSIGGLVGDAPMRGTMTAELFPLQWFEPFLASTGASRPVGRLDGSVEMEGSPGSPSFRGGLSLAQGELTLAELGVRYRDANANLTFRGTEILIDSASVRSDDGTLSAEGSVTVSRIDRPSYDLTAVAEAFTAVRSSAVHATVSGRVDVQGAGLTPRVGGVVEVERADLYLADLMSGSNVDAVTLTPRQWEELASVFGYSRPDDGAETSPLMDSVTLDLDVRLGRASWVRQRSNPELALQFSGEMSVQKQPGDSIQLVGSVEAVPDRSWVEQFGRRFDITQGVLTFQGTPATTEVDVQAEYHVPSRGNPGEPEVVLTLDVTGTPEDLSLELSSTPPLEASDMVAYLVTGRPASQSLSGGGGGSLTDAGGALALGRLSGAVESYAREEIGLDVVEITTDGLDGVTLLAGRYLSPALYLGMRQPISLQGGSEDPTQRAPNTELELELQAVRWLLLNLRAGGRRGIEFYVRSRIAYD